VAKAQHVCGNERASRDILKEASVFVDSVPQDDAAGASGRLQSLHTLSVYQAEVGDFDTAMKTAAKIQKPDLLGFGAQAVQSQRAWATAGIAIRQAKAGRFADALKTARSIDEIDYGDASRTDWKNYAYIGIADAQARAKESGQAAQTASLIKADQDRAEALATIAMRQAEAGNRAGAEMTLKTALKIAEALPANVGTLYSRKVPILSAVARVQADMGDLKGALETCEQMPINSKTQKSVAAERELVLLRDNLRSGDRAGALEMAKQFPAGREYPDRNHALGLVVDAQLKAKDLGGAVATLAEMQSAVKLRAAVDIALAMARSGDKPGALRLLQQTAKELEDVSYDPNDDTGRPMLAYKLAGGWTAVGEPKAAGEWIAREPSPYVQVFALLGMIDAVARRDGRQELVFEW
jgi:hypothetical protein